jgi:hypothetical protein
MCKQFDGETFVTCDTYYEVDEVIDFSKPNHELFKRELDEKFRSASAIRWLGPEHTLKGCNATTRRGLVPQKCVELAKVVR